ncbi:MAG: hypothetical protein CM15mP74_10270 [Halieaceae bacterium]|nr:MAG: hypothetical protein CM15mP74_10270 [Halieaceae bacterium]
MALVMPFMTVGPLSRWRDDTAARWLHELLVPGMAIVAIAVSLGFLGKEASTSGSRSRSYSRVGCTRRCQGRLASPRQSRRVIALAEFDSQLYGYGGRAHRICRRRAGCRRRDAAKCRTDLRMAVGDQQELGGYRFEMLSVGQQAGPNYLADQAVFAVTRDGQPVATLIPEKRRYFASGQIMTEAAIDASIWRDLYIALGAYR